MEAHIRIFALLCIVLGLFGFMSGAFYFVFFGGLSNFSNLDPMDVAWVAWMALLLLLSIPFLLAGWGLLQHRTWGRTLGTVVCMAGLFLVPLGTAVGLYGLWILMSSEADPLFAARFGQRIATHQEIESMRAGKLPKPD